MRKIRWIKPPDGLRHEGMIEENDADLCAAWVKAGMAEYVTEKSAKTDADEKAEDLEQRRRPVEEKAMKEPTFERSMSGGKTKKR